MSYSSEVLADEPRVYYRMNEASGAPQDSSGNNRDMNDSGLGTYQMPSPLTTEPTDYSIRSTTWTYTPDDPVLDVGDVLTMECWLKRERTATKEYLFNKGANSYALAVDSTDTIQLEKFAVAAIVQSSVTITDTAWHHIVCTKDGATVKVYIDGVDRTGTVTNQTLADTTDSLNFGRNNVGAQAFQGNLDEIALYATALSAERVRAHYLAGILARRRYRRLVGPRQLAGTPADLYTVPDFMRTRIRRIWANNPSAGEVEVNLALSYETAVLLDNPVAYYRMNEASGQPQDSSGNNNHTDQMVGTPTYGVASPIQSDPEDTAIQFNGAEGYSAPEDGTLDFGDVFSLECWMRKDTSAVMNLVSKGPDAGQLAVVNDEIQLVKDNVGTIVPSSISITDNGWHHIVATKNGASSAKLYIDGVDRSGTVTDRTCVSGTHALTLGTGSPGMASLFLDGALDEVAVYNAMLSAERVAAHYAAGSGLFLAQQPVAAGEALDLRRKLADHTLTAGETLTGWADTGSAVVLVIDGVEESV